MRFFAIGLLMTGCISNKVTMLAQEPVTAMKECKVKIFPSVDEAKSNGDIESLCLISREENMNVSVSEAVSRASTAVCGCGTNLVYVKSTQSPSFINNASVELVGFRYKEKTGD